MTIPRLPPAIDQVDVNLHVNVNLVPYFTKFYQDTKLEGDTPEVFLLRVMKKQVVDHFLTNPLRDALAEQELINDEAIQAIINDGNQVSDEVD